MRPGGNSKPIPAASPRGDTPTAALFGAAEAAYLAGDYRAAKSDLASFRKNTRTIR